MNLVMMEGEACEVEEDVIVAAINFGLESMRPVIELQDRMRQEIGKAKRTFEVEPIDEELSRKGSGSCRGRSERGVRHFR